MDRYEASMVSFEPDAPSTAIISITDVGSIPNSFQNPVWLKAVLKLQFDDVLDGERNCITQADAKAISDFVCRAGSDVSRLIVHCEAGVSRSAGVAAAILNFISGDGTPILKDQRFYPNMTCYRKVIQAFSQESKK